MKYTARRNSFSARSRCVVVGRRSILPDPTSSARIGWAGAAWAALAATFGAGRDGEDLALRFGTGAVSSVARRSMSTFPLRARGAGARATGVGDDLGAALAAAAGREPGT